MLWGYEAVFPQADFLYKSYERRVFILKKTLISSNLIYKSFYHLYILLQTNFGTVYSNVFLHATKVEQLHKIQNSYVVELNILLFN